MQLTVKRKTIVWLLLIVMLECSGIVYATRAGIVQKLIAKDESGWVLLYEFMADNGEWQKVILTDKGQMRDRVSCLSYRRFILNLRIHNQRKANCYKKGEVNHVK